MPPKARRAPAEKKLLTVPEAAIELDIGERKTWALVRQGVLGSIKIGKLRKVPRADIEAFIERQRVTVTPMHPSYLGMGAIA